MRVSDIQVPKGHIVQATTGRDEGRWFLTVHEQQGAFLFLADGDSRRMARPKKKNVRHVRILGKPDDAEKVLQEICVMRDEGQREAAIRSCIRQYRQRWEAQAAESAAKAKEES
jgi:ribosomal protein L14E/L6E/L27E